ncbi:MAG: redoxin domain-containing protein [Pedobacter sp.]|nr:MAG: redoxin domain-containing protein [Pedobacter sp.]
MNIFSTFLKVVGISTLVISLSGKLKPTEEPNYIINGTLKGVKSDWIYLVLMDTSLKTVKVDSAAVTAEKFTFTGSVNKPELGYLGIGVVDKKGKRTGLILQGEFVIDKGTTTIVAHEDSLAMLKASGSKGQNEFGLFRDKVKPFYQAGNKLHGQFLAAEKKKNNVLLKSINQQRKQNNEQIKQAVLMQVERYPASIVSAIIVKNHLSYLDAQNLKKICESFTEEVNNSPFGKVVYRKMITENRTALGNLAPTFELPDQNGQIVSLKQFQGKYTLVDFWASWCGPCRLENPNLINAYKQFKEKGLEIIGVSMDDNKQAWLDAIKVDKLPWIHVSDLKGSKSEMKYLYGITSIPTNYLLDKEGRIIARDIRSTEVQTVLAKYMK